MILDVVGTEEMAQSATIVDVPVTFLVTAVKSVRSVRTAEVETTVVAVAGIARATTVDVLGTFRVTVQVTNDSSHHSTHF